MPLYTYKCKPNDHIFEVKQNFEDDPIQTCPECGGEVRKIINSVGVVFKGSGFYVTDTRNGKGSTNGSNKSDKSTTDTPAESKTESKESTTTTSSETSTTKADTSPKTEVKAKNNTDA